MKINTQETLLKCLPFALCLFAFALPFNGCVPADQLPIGSIPMAPSTSTASAYPDLEAGSMSITSMHFTIKAYSQTDADAIKDLGENLYNKIGNDSGLYSYLASQNFVLVAYRDRDEYLKKTHQPGWSHAIASGKAVYFYYPDNDLEPNLMHQMVHMIFETYMGDKASTYKWLEEGLAMNEELSRMAAADVSAYAASKSGQLAQNHMPFSQMTFFVSPTEEKRRTDIWYQQVESVVTYLLSQGSALGFAQFVGELHSGVDIDQALSDSYPGKIRSMTDLETSWKYSIQAQ